MIPNVANINAADASGITPLMKACQLGNAAIVDNLVSNGADIYVEFRDGKTILECAEENFFNKVICQSIKAAHEKHKKLLGAYVDEKSLPEKMMPRDVTKQVFQYVAYRDNLKQIDKDIAEQRKNKKDPDSQHSQDKTSKNPRKGK